MMGATMASWCQQPVLVGQAVETSLDTCIFWSMHPRETRAYWSCKHLKTGSGVHAQSACGSAALRCAGGSTGMAEQHGQGNL